MLSGDDGFWSLPKPTGVPYYTELPVSAGDQEAPPYDDHHDYVFIPGVHAEAFFPVSGCSMSPTVNPGDLVGVVLLAAAVLFQVLIAKKQAAEA